MALGAWIHVQFRKVVDYAVSVDRTPWNGDQYERNVTQFSAHQDPRSPTQSQKIVQRWPDDIEMSFELHRQAPVDFSLPAPWKNDVSLIIRTQEPNSVSIELMDIDSDSDQTLNTEPVLLEEPAYVMERSLVLALDYYIGLSRVLESQSGETK
ncbi:hypothetical protein AYI70_g11682 [Smittium culicis]|uniref:Uncharacterized protein n=1 Tax=Smittium culicis TaxID=133412 RepID=A0A1R1X0R5_9FUNG|nr:hypothetical protein AYI70_g11682 [Smittium culicis]